MQKLAVFDIDGTITQDGVVPESIEGGFAHLRELGYITTVSTGRGYVRAREALGKHFDAVVVPDSLMIVEHGTKIVDAKGNVIEANYLQQNELDHIVDFTRVNSDITRLVWFNPPQAGSRVQVWCQEKEDVAAEMQKRGHYADVFTCSYKELRERLSQQSLSNVSVKLKDYVVVENLKLHFTRSEIDTIFQDKMMEFVRNVADKAKAVEHIAAHLAVNFENILVAGNAINDVDMLNLGVGKRILVGEKDGANSVFKYLTAPETVVQVDSPEALGLYLQKL